MKYAKIDYTSDIRGDEPYEGETIENKIERVMLTGEPIEDGAPLIYTERKDGVKPEHNIRTDKWDQALMAMDAVNRTRMTKTMEAFQKPSSETENSSESKTSES